MMDRFDGVSGGRQQGQIESYKTLHVTDPNCLILFDIHILNWWIRRKSHVVSHHKQHEPQRATEWIIGSGRPVIALNKDAIIDEHGAL